MNMGEKLTFNGLFDRVEFVEIPIIQRDYAQGRKDEYEVRNTFLDALYLALTADHTNANQSLDLDFIYGNIEAKFFKTFKMDISMFDAFSLEFGIVCSSLHLLYDLVN